MVKNKVFRTICKYVSSNRIVLILLVVPIIAFYVSNHYYQIMLIQGDSMLPSYHNMQFVVLDRYDRQYSYNDVIAFECDGLSTVLVKRIAACPNDEVVIKNRTLYVNGAVSEVYPLDTEFEYAGQLESPIVLSDTQYIVIGDNISRSKDSRYAEVGCVSESSIIGKIK